jgi:glucodextranase-like protein
MTTRRDNRQHVRPRPPSSGRPAPVKVKPRAPASDRLAGHRSVRRGRGIPVFARLGLIALVVVLGVGVLTVAAGGLGIVVGGMGSTLTGFIDDVTSTPSPKATVAAVVDAPTLEQPTEPYTSQRTADLVVTVPASLAGDTAHKIRVYLALQGQSPSPIQESPIADSTKTVVPVELADGINDFFVSIVGPGGESDTSLTARYVYDATPPKITITTPKNNATVNRQAVDIKGKTQARTTLQARNDANGSSISGTAQADGSFDLSVGIAPGVNKITINGTDPAGNVSQVVLNVKRGNGKLTVDLRAADYSIRRSQLPEPVTLYATVTDPDGRPLAGANVTFTLSMPGIPTVTIDTTTDASGNASFRTTVPKSADVGQGSAAVLVSTDQFGSTQDFTVITITR